MIEWFEVLTPFIGGILFLYMLLSAKDNKNNCDICEPYFDGEGNIKNFRKVTR